MIHWGQTTERDPDETVFSSANDDDERAVIIILYQTNLTDGVRFLSHAHVCPRELFVWRRLYSF